ncbi:MAG: sugar phosphate nucleotidyltransferase [Vicinamibacterales bacterium]
MSPFSPPAALLLTAGLGQRLAPLTEVRAKPAVPLAGEAIERRILRSLAAQRVTDVVLNLHYRPESIAAVVGDGSDLGVRVRYSWEQPQILGGAGGPRRALPIIGADRFFIVNGDTLTDVSLDRLAAAHAASGALVSLAVTPNHEPQRYGGIRMDRDGRVSGFARRGVEARGSFHFVGVQVVEAAAFVNLSPDSPTASIGGLYDALLAGQAGSVMGVVFESPAFWDVGTVEDYWRTSQAWLTHEAPGAWCGESTHVDPGARITRSIVWDDVRIPRGCVIDECIVTDGVHLAEGSQYERSILIASQQGVRVEPLGFTPS